MALTKMQRVLQADQKRAQSKRGDRREGLKAQLSVDALMSAVRHEGKYILGSEGIGYWKDMERRYPHLNLLKHKDTGDSPNGHRCRHGKVTRRFIPGQGWFVWKGGEMVKEEPLARARQTLGKPLAGARQTLGQPLAGARQTLGKPLAGARQTLGQPLARAMQTLGGRGI